MLYIQPCKTHQQACRQPGEFHTPYLCLCQRSRAVTDGAAACTLDCASDCAVWVHRQQPADLGQLPHLVCLCKMCGPSTTLHMSPKVARRPNITCCCVHIELLLACWEITGEYESLPIFSAEFDHLQHRQVEEGVCDCSLGPNVAG